MASFASSSLSLLPLIVVLAVPLVEFVVVDAMEERLSVLWPEARVELYTPSSQVLRTLTPDGGLEFLCDADFCQSDMDAIRSASTRFVQSLRELVPRPLNKAAGYPINPTKRTLWPLQGIHFTTNHTGVGEINDKQAVVDESFSLYIPPVVDNDGYVALSARTVQGAVYGMQALLQLARFGWIDAADAPVFAIDKTPIRVEDAPAYPYRGLLIDTSRHFLPLSLILRNLDAMEMNRLNVLHWHLCDSQSWPWRTKTYPELSEMGAYCSTCIYTSLDIAKVIREAAYRGIRVVLEVDLPGHCQAIGASHPELLTQCGKKGASEPLDVTKWEVYDFVRALYDEIGDLVPSRYVHVGGDEVPLDCWKTSQSIQSWMKRHNMTDEKQLLGYFESTLLKYVTNNLGKTPIVWQELFDSGLELPMQTVVDVWKEWDLSARDAATGSGYEVLLSACWYLDHLDKDWRAFYRCDPRDFNGTKEQRQLVIGGHASMWGERVDETNFMSRVWPRASAVAEKLWTGNSTDAAETAQIRLERFRCDMVQRGFAAAPISPGSCERFNRGSASHGLASDTTHQVVTY